ncbi:MAG TPA: beta-L-arabinofuranosidase domain-containing protein [Terracidiphilus sp.]|nr:beta-L-arabinofuranosidase domain-containing protein [Terracidiphilus sp.]
MDKLNELQCGSASRATGDIADNTGKCELDRREFLRLTLMSGAMLAAAGAGVTAEAEEAMAAAPKFAVLTPLAPGAVRPEGWLKLYLDKQAAELGSKLPEISWPFTSPYWAGEEQGPSWWPWEQMAYWVDGAARLALVTGDEALLTKVQKTIGYTLDHADPDGYLGPQFFKNPRPEFGSKTPTDDFHRWPQNVFFRGVEATSEAGVNRRVAEALQKHYLNDKEDYGKPTRNVTNVEDILWTYERTGNPRLLAMAEKAWADYLTVTTEHADGGDLAPMRVFADTPIDAHGVTYIETAKQPAILYLYTGKDEYLRFAHAAMRRVFDHHMLIDGIPSTSEFYRTRTALDSHETCDIADHAWSWGYMLMATGDARWADATERGCLNAGFGALKKDWKALQYFSCPNQFLATLDSDHNVMEHGGRKMGFQPNPGQATACCGGNVHRVFPNFVIRMWMKDTKGGLAAVHYGPSRVKTTVGAGNEPIEITQKTNYPFEEQIALTLNMEKPVEFPLSLRIPEWCTEPQIAVNGVAVAVPALDKGFARIARSWKPGDTVTLTMPMKMAVTRWPQDGIGVEHGPLVYALDIKAEWTPIVEAKYTTKDYPSWKVMPAGPWNYGLVVDEAHLNEQVKLTRKTMTEDPWVDPPVTMTVPARTIADWELQANPKKPQQLFTPPLPEVEYHKLGEEQTLTLVPYGATHLRLTIFPALGKGEKKDLI